MVWVVWLMIYGLGFMMFRILGVHGLGDLGFGVLKVLGCDGLGFWIFSVQVSRFGDQGIVNLLFMIQYSIQKGI